MDFLPEMTPEHAPEQQSRSAAARARQRGARSERVCAQDGKRECECRASAESRDIVVRASCAVLIFFANQSSGKKE